MCIFIIFIIYRCLINNFRNQHFQISEQPNKKIVNYSWKKNELFVFQHVSVHILDKNKQYHIELRKIITCIVGWIFICRNALIPWEREAHPMEKDSDMIFVGLVPRIHDSSMCMACMFPLTSVMIFIIVWTMHACDWLSYLEVGRCACWASPLQYLKKTWDMPCGSRSKQNSGLYEQWHLPPCTDNSGGVSPSVVKSEGRQDGSVSTRHLPRALFPTPWYMLDWNSDLPMRFFIYRPNWQSFQTTFHVTCRFFWASN